MKGLENTLNNFGENNLGIRASEITLPVNNNSNGVKVRAKEMKPAKGGIITSSTINGVKVRAKELLEVGTKVIKLPKFFEEQIERIIECNPSIPKEELRKIIEGFIKLPKFSEEQIERIIECDSSIPKEELRKIIEGLFKVVELPKFSKEQIERIMNTIPANSIPKEGLRKIIEGLSNKKIIIIKGLKFTWSEANKKGKLLSPEELIIISTLKNKHADSKNNDMLYELSEALQFKCYLSNAKYSENTISIVNMVHSYISSANEKNSLGGIILYL